VAFPSAELGKLAGTLALGPAGSCVPAGRQPPLDSDELAWTSLRARTVQEIIYCFFYPDMEFS